MNTEQAIFAAGCFWGVEALFREIAGVTNVEAGYTGGKRDMPTYEQVCSGATGHAEAVRVTFDPRIVPYETLLRKFYTMHDPTQVDRQGPDVGSQYRSAIFYMSDEQKDLAEQLKHEFQLKHQNPIATEITEAQTFWPAEEYHQNYFAKNENATCSI
ncbi:peptide-methionine (S)-S-oxide reductase MsrA [Patescibacteria group bacterium]|nr:peptide-methionine (S)-S-oxide reductase MsrA [Patescibacteria group bacterium]MBU1755321.1 peptide-methionine (S)-S-oxide reductase MsrA [Patescibacteria group bacterium]